MAFYKYFWDLADSTTYSNHTVGSFDNNTTTGGGEFRWIGNVSNVSITNIPGIRIKPTATTVGYWERVMNGPLNVSWFGCQNTDTAPNTFAQLGVSQTTLNTRYGVGFATTSDNYDTTAIRYAFSIMGSYGKWNAIEFEPKVYWLTRSCQLPLYETNATNTYLGIFKINGNGATLRKAVTTQFDWFTRYPTTQVNADIYVKNSFIIENFKVNGTGGVWQSSGYAFLNLGATTNSVISNIVMENFDIGLRLEYAVNCSVSSIYGYNIKTNTILVKSGGWTGAGLTNSNSFVNINGVYINDTFNQNACIAYYASGGSIKNIYINGSGTPAYVVLIDTLDSTAITSFSVNRASINVDSSIAAVYLRAREEGDYEFENINCTVAQTIIASKPYAGQTDVYVGNMPLFPTGSKFYNEGTTTWDLDRVRFGATISTAADVVNGANNLWVTTGSGTIPLIANVRYNPPIVP